MKLKSLLAALFLSTCFLTSCSKDDDKADPAPTNQDPTNNNPQNTPGMTAKVNNADWTAAIPTALYQNNDLTVAGGALNGVGLAISSQGGAITQPGTYSVIGVYTESPGGTTTGPSWVGPAGTLTLTKLDLTNKKVSGTFSFMAIAVPNTGATGTKSITSGSFTDITFQ